MEQGNNFVPWVEDNLSSSPGESSSLSGKDNSYLQNYLIVLVQLYHIYNMLFVSCPTSCDRYSMKEKNRINSFEDNPSELFIFFFFSKIPAPLFHWWPGGGCTCGRDATHPVAKQNSRNLPYCLIIWFARVCYFTGIFCIFWRCK